MHQRLARLSVLPHIEFILLDAEFVIVQISNACERFWDDPSCITIGNSIFDALPELYGLEEVMESILNEEMEVFELKAISRHRPDGSLHYFDLYIIPEDDIQELAIKPEKSTENLARSPGNVAIDIVLDTNLINENTVNEKNHLELNIEAESLKNSSRHLLIFLEDVTNTMSLEQTLVQASNEMSLVLDRLSASEAYIHQLVASIGDLLIVTDVKGKILRTNYRLQEILGYKESEVIGQSLTVFFDDPNFDLPQIQEYLLQEDQEILRNVETICHTKKGSRVVLSFSCSIIQPTASQTQSLEAQNEFIYLGRDVTKSHYAHQRLVAQSSISKVLSETNSLQEALPQLIQGICVSLDWDIGEFWQPHCAWMPLQLSRQDMELRCESLWTRSLLDTKDWSEIRRAARIPNGKSWVGQAWSKKQSIWLTDVSSSVPFMHREQASRLLLNTALFSPLVVDGEMIGILSLFSQDIRDRDPDMIQMLEALGSQIAQFVRRKRAELALRQEQQRTEELLLNILPGEIAERLKHDPSTIAEHYSDVSVMFADIVGFTRLSSTISPAELVRRLNQIFSTFDELSEQHGLEKIKTIGDAYMVVGGLPVPRVDHAQAIAQMALDMQAAIDLFNQNSNSDAINIRIGIHSGPVIAGVIGIKKFIYDLWGDTVNIASRMESHGLTGQIQVSETTYNQLKEKFILCERGEIQLKGRGLMRTFFLIGRKGDHHAEQREEEHRQTQRRLPSILQPNSEIADLIERRLQDKR